MKIILLMREILSHWSIVAFIIAVVWTILMDAIFLKKIFHPQQRLEYIQVGMFMVFFTIMTFFTTGILAQGVVEIIGAIASLSIGLIVFIIGVIIFFIGLF